MNEIDEICAHARLEYEQLGTLSTFTFMSLTNYGVDAQEFLNDLEDQA